MSDFIKGDTLVWFLDELANSEPYQFESGEIEIVVGDEYGNEGVTEVKVQDLAESANEEIAALKSKLLSLTNLFKSASSDIEALFNNQKQNFDDGSYDVDGQSVCELGKAFEKSPSDHLIDLRNGLIEL